MAKVLPEKNGSVVYLPQEKPNNLKKGSCRFLELNSFSLLKPEEEFDGHPQLLRGPRRVVRLCVFALLVPAALITVPLYVRLVLYPPAHYPMMPTDQRLLARHASSFWCQAQWTHMNGSYNAYVSNKTPPASLTRSNHNMMHSTTLQDDVKEYWGFHLLKGSTVTISACASTDGGQLMILRGVNNLRRCAWIGEEDSFEDGEVVDGKADYSKENKTESSPYGQAKSVEITVEKTEHSKEIVSESSPYGRAKSIEITDGKTGHSKGNVTKSSPEREKNSDEPMVSINGRDNLHEMSLQRDDPEADSDEALTSEERRNQLEYLLRRAVKMSKNKQEILRLLHMLHRSEDRPLPRHLQQRLGIIDEGDDALKHHRSRGSPDKSTEDKTPSSRHRRETIQHHPTVDNNGAHEVFDTENKDEENITFGSTKAGQNHVESIIGGHIFFPEGLRVEQGKFNQTNTRDGSNEEHVSSYSSSEEALATCEGVIMTLPLNSYRGCSFRWVDYNQVVYDIPITGTYYFVFSSDNEISSNDLFFNLTLERVTYDTQSAVKLCTNTTECSLPLAFLSDEQTLVEVPEDESWSNAYVLDTVCRPRVPIFLAFLLAAPLLILLCAFH